MVHDAVNDPSTQAAFAHVMEAAATETKALTQLSGPATAPAPGVSHPHHPPALHHHQKHAWKVHSELLHAATI